MVYLLYTEETSMRRDPKSRFFIYGGMFFPIDALTELHNLVQRSRDDSGFHDGDELKFSASSRPKHLPKEQHAAARRNVLNGCQQLGARLITTIVLPGIAKGRPMGELVGWGVNSVLGVFEDFLTEENASGICIFDRLPFTQPYKYLKTRFQAGVMSDDGTARRLEQVQLLSLSCAGASHVASAVDIVIGSLKYCLNEKEPSETCRAMLPGILGMMWHKKEGDSVQLRGCGLQFSPAEVKISAYQQQYDDLTQRLEGFLKEGL
jgi:hypothetical protein